MQRPQPDDSMGDILAILRAGVAEGDYGRGIVGVDAGCVGVEDVDFAEFAAVVAGGAEAPALVEFDLAPEG